MLNHCCFNKNICIYECFINFTVDKFEKMDIENLIAVFERKLIAAARLLSCGNPIPTLNNILRPSLCL